MSGGSQIFFGAATPACWTVSVHPLTVLIHLYRHIHIALFNTICNKQNTLDTTVRILYPNIPYNLLPYLGLLDF